MLQRDALGQPRAHVDVARQHLALGGHQQDVVEGERFAQRFITEHVRHSFGSVLWARWIGLALRLVVVVSVGSGSLVVASAPCEQARRRQRRRRRRRLVAALALEHAQQRIDHLRARGRGAQQLRHGVEVGPRRAAAPSSR